MTTPVTEQVRITADLLFKSRLTASFLMLYSIHRRDPLVCIIYGFGLEVSGPILAKAIVGHEMTL